MVNLCSALLAEGFRGVRHSLTFFDHSHDETFLETAELAPVPPPLVHRAVFICKAHVFCIFLYSSLLDRREYFMIEYKYCCMHTFQKMQL